MKFIYSLLLLSTATFCNFAMANHSGGLHLQISTDLIDIQPSDIEQTEVFSTGTKTAAVMLKLKPALAEHLHKLTEKKLGQTAVWIWSGRVVSVEEIKEPFDQNVTIHNFTALEADDFKRKTPSIAAD